MPVMVGVGMMFMQICTGINTIIYYTATIFKAAGFADTIGALYATIGVGVVNFLMTFVAIFFTDKVGRKPLLYAGLTGVTLSLFALGSSFLLTDYLGDNLKWVAVGSIVVYIACFAFSLGPIGWIIVSEIMPLKIRGMAMSLCTMANFGFNFVVALTFPVLLQKSAKAILSGFSGQSAFSACSLPISICLKPKAVLWSRLKRTGRKAFLPVISKLKSTAKNKPPETGALSFLPMFFVKRNLLVFKHILLREKRKKIFSSITTYFRVFKIKHPDISPDLIFLKS